MKSRRVVFEAIVVDLGDERMDHAAPHLLLDVDAVRVVASRAVEDLDAPSNSGMRAFMCSRCARTRARTTNRSGSTGWRWDPSPWRAQTEPKKPQRVKSHMRAGREASLDHSLTAHGGRLDSTTDTYDDSGAVHIENLCSCLTRCHSTACKWFPMRRAQ